jgi:glycosyltransferase involved in cell wall biosynthesis
MDNNLFVSVVIPLYNCEQFIRRAIMSVLNQTVRDFELIVVDDGSTDSGYQKVLEIKDSRIKLIRQENQGASVARNNGIEQACSPLVTFLDSDDEWKPDFLEEMRILISKYPDCVLYGAGYETIRFDGVSWISKDLFPVDWSGIIPNYIKVLSSFPFCTCSVVIKRTTLIEIGGFPVGVKYGQDVATWLRCSLVGKIAYLNQPLVTVHRDVTNSSTLRFDWRQEPYPVRLLKQLLHDHVIPRESYHDALDYIARSSLMTSKARFRAGEPLQAFFPLWNCLWSTTYRNKIFPLLQVQLLPSMKKAIYKSIHGILSPG